MKTLFSVLTLLLTISSYAQDKVSWSVSFDDKNSEVVLHADIAEGWHLYSQNLGNDMGPIPTEFTFDANKEVKFAETTTEPKPLKSYDENFGSDLSYFEEEVDFRNKITVKANTTITGSVLFMVCNDQMCLPPSDYKFELKIK